jgi:DNA-binding beta-propeller fold protein YncE
MKNVLFLITLSLVVNSCVKVNDIPTDPTESIVSGNGVFIVNEGNFKWGNGSLSYYSYDADKIYNDIFLKINGWPLGDVPNSIEIDGDKAYIVVNNSGKIEVVNRNSLEAVATINGLNSPRNISFVNSEKAYVTNMYSDSVAIISLLNNSITGYINIRRSSESVVISGNKAFISNWIGGKEIMVINNITDKVIDSIEVGAEPESMVIDRYNMLWILCNGGWARQNYAELVSVNTISDRVESRFVFPTKQASPSCLTIDGTGETLYYLDGGVRQMNISSAFLPETALISGSGANFYKIAVNPLNSDILITDAVDYIQEGKVMLYKKDGTFVSIMQAGIIPGSMCFKLNIHNQTK